MLKIVLGRLVGSPAFFSFNYIFCELQFHARSKGAGMGGQLVVVIRAARMGSMGMGCICIFCDFNVVSCSMGGKSLPVTVIRAANPLLFSAFVLVLYMCFL